MCVIFLRFQRYFKHPNRTNTAANLQNVVSMLFCPYHVPTLSTMNRRVGGVSRKGALAPSSASEKTISSKMASPGILVEIILDGIRTTYNSQYAYIHRISEASVLFWCIFTSDTGLESELVLFLLFHLFCYFFIIYFVTLGSEITTEQWLSLSTGV